MGGKHLTSLRFGTKVIRGGRSQATPVRSHIVPIYQTVNFEYEDFAQNRRVSDGEEAGYFYTRFGNPTVDALNDAVALLEEGEEAISFASGMAAICAAAMSRAERGDHILSSSVIYGGTQDLFKNFLPKQGIEVTFVDIHDHEAVRKGFRKKTKILYAEPMMNPTLMLADVPALANMAREQNVFLLIDNTFTPPFLCQPLILGADGVVHSTTKYIGGHGDTMGGIAIGSSEFIDGVRTMAKMYGGVMSPFNAWLSLRGLRTLNVRLERACGNAFELARFLEGHPKIIRVNYPGLESHPHHALAKNMLKDFGAMVSFEVEGGLEAVRKVFDGFKVITSTVSLGEVDTIAAHPISSSHKKLTPEQQEAFGIREGLIRLSVGIEDVEDLKEDLEKVLGAL